MVRPSRKSLVLIEPTITSIDNPDSLSAQLDREPAFPFPYPELDEVDSLDAIGKDSSSKHHQQKRSNKYKTLLGAGKQQQQHHHHHQDERKQQQRRPQQQQQQQPAAEQPRKSGKEIPLLRPLYLSNTDRPTHHPHHHHHAYNNKEMKREKSDRRRRASEEEEQQQQHRDQRDWYDHRESAKNDGRGEKETCSGSYGGGDHHRGSAAAFPSSPGDGTARRSNKYSARLTMVVKPSFSSDDDASSTTSHQENDPGRSNKYSETLHRLRRRSGGLLTLEDGKDKTMARKRSSSSHARVVTTPRAGSGGSHHHRRSRSPSARDLLYHRERSFSVDDAPPPKPSHSSSHARLSVSMEQHQQPKPAAAAAASSPSSRATRLPFSTTPRGRMSRSPFASISQRRQRSFSVDDPQRQTTTTTSSSLSSRGSPSSPRVGWRPRSPFASRSQQQHRQRTFFSADDHHRPLNKPQTPASPSGGGATTPKARGLPLLRSLSFRRRRSGSIDDGGARDPPESRAASSSSHARLPTTTEDSGSQQSVLSYLENRPWKISNSGGLSLVSSLKSSPGTMKNNNGSTSKNSQTSSLASSLDAGSTPDEIIAFGAVLDHITKGGSILNANRVFRNEVQTRDRYRSEAPIQASYNRANLHGGKLPPTFVKRKEYRRYHDDDDDPSSYDHSTTATSRLTSGDDVTNLLEVLRGESDDTQESEIPCDDKYATNEDDGGGEDSDSDGTKNDDDSDEGSEEEESDWCVPSTRTLDTGTAGTAGTSTLLGVKSEETPSVMFRGLGIDPFATPESEGSDSDSSDYSSSCASATDEYTSSNDDDDDDSGSETNESASDDDCDDSSCSSSSEGVSTDHSSSTISSYTNSLKVSNHHRATRGVRETKAKRTPKKSKLLRVFQGKKPVKGISIVKEGGDGTAINNGMMTTNKVVQVDRLPDSFEDDNDENANNGNSNSKNPAGKKVGPREQQQQQDSKDVADTTLKYPETAADGYHQQEEQKRESGRKNSSKREKKSRKKRQRRKRRKEKKKEEEITNDFEDVLASKFRVLKQFVGIEEVDDNEGRRGAEPPVPKAATNDDPPEENTKQSVETSAALNRGPTMAQAVSATTEDTQKGVESGFSTTVTESFFPKLKETAAKAIELNTTTTRADPSEPKNDTENMLPIADEPAAASKLPENASTERPELKVDTPESGDGNNDDGEKDENVSICGASLALESIISLESLLEGDTPTFIKTVVETATHITNESMRSARSMFFPDDDDCSEDAFHGMTAADEFENQMNMMDDKVDVIIDSVCSTEERTPKEIWVPEYADCDEEADGDHREQQGGGLDLADHEKGPEENSEEKGAKSKKKEDSNAKERKEATGTATKRKPFRKRIPFLQFKKGSKQQTEEKLTENIDDSSSTSSDSLQVDIYVYNREKTLVGPAPTGDFDVSPYPHIYNGDKPLIDSAASMDDGEEEETPQTMMASCTTQSMVTSCDVMVAAKNAVQDLEPTSHLVSLGMICCGGIPTADQIIPQFNNDPASATAADQGGRTASSTGNIDEDVDNQGGPLVRSSVNDHGEDNDWSEAIGTSVADCGAYYMEECLKPGIEGQISKNLLAASAKNNKFDSHHRPVAAERQRPEMEDGLGDDSRDESPIEQQPLSSSDHTNRRNSGSEPRKSRGDNNNSSRSRRGRSLFGRKKKEGRRTMLV